MILNDARAGSRGLALPFDDVKTRHAVQMRRLVVFIDRASGTLGAERGDFNPTTVCNAYWPSRDAWVAFYDMQDMRVRPIAEFERPFGLRMLELLTRFEELACRDGVPRPEA